MANIKKSIRELIGHTPLLELTNYEAVNRLEAEIDIKVEYFNVNQSVKDRIALNMIEDAESRGELKPGDTIVDLTSGNTGVATAALAAAKGYKYIVYIQDQVSRERYQVIHAFGGKTIKLTEDPGMLKVLQESNGDFIAASNYLRDEIAAKRDDYYYLNQTCNPANPDAHYKHTGPEIWSDTAGEIDVFVAAAGTGGTISGAGKYLREKNPNIYIVGVEPGPESLPSEEIPEPEFEITGVHPFNESVPQERIPLALDRTIYDEIIAIEATDAYKTAREVAKSDGILLGESSGAAILAATQIAKRPEFKGKRIVAVTADSGLRYLSSEIYDEKNL